MRTMVRSQQVSYTLSQLARAAHVGVETVRYYQRIGLMPVPDAAPGKAHRRYEGCHLDRLIFIRSAQSAGFALKDIVQLLGYERDNDRTAIQGLVTQRLAALKAEEERLREAQAGLRGLLHKCERTPAGEACPIVGSFHLSPHEGS